MAMFNFNFRFRGGIFSTVCKSNALAIFPLKAFLKKSNIGRLGSHHTQHKYDDIPSRSWRLLTIHYTYLFFKIFLYHTETQLSGEYWDFTSTIKFFRIWSLGFPSWKTQDFPIYNFWLGIPWSKWSRSSKSYIGLLTFFLTNLLTNIFLPSEAPRRC